jgi:hypothetical protein
MKIYVKERVINYLKEVFCSVKVNSCTADLR